jgi:hypothetical protein
VHTAIETRFSTPRRSFVLYLHLCADREHVTPTAAFASKRRSAVIG